MRFLTGNLVKIRPRISLHHGGQSTDDNLTRKDKVEEIKVRTGLSKADGSVKTAVTNSTNLIIYNII